MQHTREQTLVAQILDVSARLPWLVLWRLTNSAGVTEDGRFLRSGLVRGASDLLGCCGIDGRFVGIECKAGNRQPTVEQSAFLARIKRHYGIAFVAYDLDDVVEEFAREYNAFLEHRQELARAVAIVRDRAARLAARRSGSSA